MSTQNKFFNLSTINDDTLSTLYLINKQIKSKRRSENITVTSNNLRLFIYYKYPLNNIYRLIYWEPWYFNTSMFDDLQYHKIPFQREKVLFDSVIRNSPHFKSIFQPQDIHLKNKSNQSLIESIIQPAEYIPPIYNIENIKLLVQAGANILCLDGNDGILSVIFTDDYLFQQYQKQGGNICNWLPLYLSGKLDSFIESNKENNWELLRGKYDQTILHFICEYVSKYSDLINYLDLFGLLVNIGDEFDITPIMMAVYKGNISFVDRLIKMGSNIYHHDIEGNNILHCIQPNDIKMFNYLNQFGIDVFEPSRDGRISMMNFIHYTNENSLFEILNIIGKFSQRQIEFIQRQIEWSIEYYQNQVQNPSAIKGLEKAKEYLELMIEASNV